MKVNTEPLHFFEHQYAIVDQTLVGNYDDMPGISLALDELKHQKNSCPRLLLLNLFSSDDKKILLKQIRGDIQSGQTATVGIFLRSSVDNAGDLANYLKNKMVFNDDKRFLFRFYDPNVIAQLYWMHPSFFTVEMREFFDTWTIYLNREYYSLGIDPKNIIVQEHSISSKKLKHIGIINRVLSNTNDRLLSFDEHVDKSMIIETYIERAKSYGLTDQGDLVTFSVHALLLGSKFDEQSPLMNTLLRDIKSKRTGSMYKKICNNLTRSEWDEIFAQLDIHDSKIKRKALYG